MYLKSSKRFKFSPKHKQLLQDIVISSDYPGSIIYDFDVLLEYIRDHDIVITGTHLLPIRILPEINAYLKHPLQVGLKRPQQKSYPHIHGLYLLVRASGLTYVSVTSKKSFLQVDKTVYQMWKKLNPTERYGILLETWLLRGKPEIIGEHDRSSLLVPDNFQECIEFFYRIPDKGMQIIGDRDAEFSLRYSPCFYNLGLLEMFGLIKVHHGPPEEGKGWRIKSILRTPFGDALLALLFTEFFIDLANIFRLDDEGTVPFGTLQSVLFPYFSEWKNNLFIQKIGFQDGVHIFKVQLGRICRQIAIPADHSLDALASIILNSVGFDRDHLYQFSYKNRFGVLEYVYHPHMEGGPWASEVLVGDIGLSDGQKMTYLYDFGDQWKFDLTLEKVDPAMVIENPIILKAQGDPPEQYRMEDDY